MKCIIKRCTINRIISVIIIAALSFMLSYFVNSISVINIEPADSNKPVPSETENTESTDNINYDDTLILSHPTETDLTVEQAQFTITGVCKLGQPIKINDIAVSCYEDGTFSYDYILSPGENIITVSNAYKTIELNIKYNYTIIKGVSPSKAVTVEGGSTVNLSAEALKGASVIAEIGGQKITLNELGGEDAKFGIDFVEFSGSYTVPASQLKKQSLGRIDFSASINGYTDTKKGASITVNAKASQEIYISAGEGEVVAPHIKGDGVVDVLTPDTDYGLGSAKICKITVPYAETMPSNVADDLSVPLFSPLLSGTYDYITGSASFDGKDYYTLNSGRKIKQSECSVSNGYVMPINTISAYKSYTDNNTNVILTMNWKVPFNSNMKNQSFHKGYQGRVYNVSSCTSSYIDFVFYYTNAAQGNFDLSGSNVVSRAEWINIGDESTTTLRVYLKNKGVFYGYSAYYSSDNRLVISFNNKPQKTSSATVMLDPGHGGKDCGAIGTNGVYESRVNIAISAMVKVNLEQAGIRVLMTRYNDTNYTLDQRQQKARDSGADLFVAIHCNSTVTGKGTLSGPEVYYYRANSKYLASSIYNKLSAVWKNIYADNSEMRNKVDAKDGGVRFYPFRVIRIEECPAVLVECGYLSNSIECLRLCVKDNQEILAKAISDGIINTLNGY